MRQLAAFLMLAGFLSACSMQVLRDTTDALERQPAMEGPVATGVVFHDRNENRLRDGNERGLKGVRVSNGVDIVETDRHGRYRLPVDDDTIIFVIKPQGWRTPLSNDNLPQFYYIHKPHGSPQLEYPGVAPTGPLPASIDFPLYKQKEPKEFRAILFGDPQPRNQKEIDYIAHDVVEELIGTDAAFGVTLGDIMFDDLDLFGSINGAIALIGIPWYNVIGNHDINFDAREDHHSDETFERVYGPSYYSFDYGRVHFIVLDDILWRIEENEEGEEEGDYVGGLSEEQLQFVENDLAIIPRDQLVVLMMHIPLSQEWPNDHRARLFRMIEQRPFCISISGHMHWHEHVFLTEADGWMGPKPHHHIINVTVSGSWWSGAPDEYGIPHTMMRGGAPNGYSIITFDGKAYSLEFKAARKPADYQISVYAPEAVDLSATTETLVMANVFNGSEKSIMEMRVGDRGKWITMNKAEKIDPYLADLKALEESDDPPRGRELWSVIESPHLWEAPLPRDLNTGTHLIEVRTTDMFGQRQKARRLIRVY